MLTRVNLLRLAALMAGASFSFTASAAAEGPCEQVFRLTDEASFAQGCVAPCACPVVLGESFRGTFILGAPSFANGFVSRPVERALWFVEIGGAELEITGSGEYLVSSGPAPRLHALDLELEVGDAAPQHFESGLVPLEGDGGLIHLEVSSVEEGCWLTTIDLDAAFVRPGSAMVFELAGYSTYQKGCFDPCDCPIEEPRPLEGTMWLVPILVQGTYTEFAVPQADFFVGETVEGQGTVALSGFGRYTLIQGFAGPIQALDLRLRSNGGEVERFDSPLENTGDGFPKAFAVEIDTNDRVCLDTVLALHAVRSHSWIFGDGFECGTTSTWSTAGGS